jgi:hypothetical protein
MHLVALSAAALVDLPFFNNTSLFPFATFLITHQQLLCGLRKCCDLRAGHKAMTKRKRKAGCRANSTGLYICPEQTLLYDENVFIDSELYRKWDRKL